MKRCLFLVAGLSVLTCAGVCEAQDFDFPVWDCPCRLKSPDPVLEPRTKTG